mmetsp:Transcript_100655/g.307606  ORF Transcript_100655/g.307606 Transcript_100655/m.307606 type:complete len:217 (+) Transcript_100655:1027-1677(+)
MMLSCSHMKYPTCCKIRMVAARLKWARMPSPSGFPSPFIGSCAAASDSSLTGSGMDCFSFFSLAFFFGFLGLRDATSFSAVSSLMCVPACAASDATVPYTFGQSRGSRWDSSEPSTSMSCMPALASTPWNRRWSSVDRAAESSAWRMVISTSAVRNTWRWCVGNFFRIKHCKLSLVKWICRSLRVLELARSFHKVARLSPGCGGSSLPTGISSKGK